MKRTSLFIFFLIIVPLAVLFLFLAAWGISEKNKWQLLRDAEEVCRYSPIKACQMLESHPSLSQGWKFRRSMYGLIYTEALLASGRQIANDSLISSALFDLTDEESILKYRSLVAMAQVQQRLHRSQIANQYIQQARLTARALGDSTLLNDLDRIESNISTSVPAASITPDEDSYVSLLIKYQELQRDSREQLFQGILATILFSSFILAGGVFFFLYDRRRRRNDFVREQRFNDYICSLQSEITQLMKRQHSSVLSVDEQERFNQLFSMSEIVRHIHHVSHQSNVRVIHQRGEYALTPSQLSDLLRAFDLCHSSFVSRLREKSSSLNDVDLSICCLLRMGVSTTTICLLLATNPEALRKRRYRIRKEKLQLPDKSTLEAYLIGF